MLIFSILDFFFKHDFRHDVYINRIPCFLHTQVSSGFVLVKRKAVQTAD